MRKVIYFLSAIVVAMYLAMFLRPAPAPPPPKAKFSSSYDLTHEWGKSFQVVRLEDEPAGTPPEVNRQNKTDPFKFLIYIHDGPTGGEVTAPMSRRQAEAELKSLYADADAEILIPDGKGGYMFAPVYANQKVQRLVLGGPGN